MTITVGIISFRNCCINWSKWGIDNPSLVCSQERGLMDPVEMSCLAVMWQKGEEEEEEEKEKKKTKI
jgi:hypothetical protein